MNEDFAAARVFLGIKSTKRRTRDKVKSWIESPTEENKVIRTYRDVSEHTGLVLMTGYPPPTLETGGNPCDRTRGGCTLIVKCFLESSRSGLTLSGRNTPDFDKMLAKIAHSYWVAENGLAGVAFVLPKFFLENQLDGLSYYIGGLHSPVPGNDLHSISHGTAIINGLKYGYVDIGLFANYGPQSNYRVYVGICL